MSTPKVHAANVVHLAMNAENFAVAITRGPQPGCAGSSRARVRCAI